MTSRREAVIAELLGTPKAFSKLQFAAHILYIPSNVFARSSCQIGLLSSKQVVNTPGPECILPLCSKDEKMRDLTLE